jgi:hypothetical protein
VADDVGNTIWRVTSASQTAATERSGPKGLRCIVTRQSLLSIRQTP